MFLAVMNIYSTRAGSQGNFVQISCKNKSDERKCMSRGLFPLIICLSRPNNHFLLVCLFLNRMYLKGTNGRQKTYEIFHVYCIFYSGFMCQTTVIFGITKDGSLVLNYISIMKLFHLQKPLSKWR